MDTHDKLSGYKDIYFRIFIALLAAHIIVAFGARQSFFTLLIHWYYYRDLLLSFLIAFFLVTEVYFATVKLDAYFDWKQHTVPRIGLQLVLGLMVPAISAFLLADLYFAAFGYRILDTDYLKFDYPVIVIMIILLNVYYLAFYFYRQWQLIESKVAVQSFEHKTETLQPKEVIIVQKGAKNIPLPLTSVSYFFHEGEYNFVRTFEREDFIISQALDDIQLQLSEKQFFRANRQVIVNFSACGHFEPLEFGKLQLTVTPPAKEPVIISQKRARSFKEWIAR